MRKDWVEVKFEEVLKLKNGYAFKSSNYQENGVPIIRISDINQGAVKTCNAKKIEESEEYDDYQVTFGDILIAMSGATTGKFGIYRETQKTYQNQRVGNLILHSEKHTNKQYIFYLLYSLRQRIEEDAYGGAQPNISGKKIESIEVNLAPFPEQRAIVAKIEQLFSELDNGIANLKTAKDKLKIYRQAVLKKAFEGDEASTSVVLFQIMEKIQIGPFGSQLHKIDYIDGGVPLINPMHIQNGKICPNKSYSISMKKRDSLPNYILRKGDVIMGRRGEMGRCGLVTNNADGWFCGTGSLYFRPSTDEILSIFLYYYLQSAIVKEFLTGKAAGTTMTNLNKKIVSNIPLNLPLITKQTQIVKEIETRLSVCDNAIKNINEALKKSEALRQSILKKAFEGKLLSDAELQACRQEPDWEPAEKLLERIKKEKK